MSADETRICMGFDAMRIAMGFEPKTFTKAQVLRWLRLVTRGGRVIGQTNVECD